MKRKNGFTLIEIIGAIVILGIIAIIAFSTYTRSLGGFREDYYENLIRTTESSGSDFFNDNRNYRPNQVLEADKVTLATLMTKNYISDIKDYNGDSCKETSYVLVVKEGKNNYTYHSCLTCEKDNYSNVESEYCDSSWLDPTKITYTLGEIEPVYVYLGSTKEELKERLTLPVSYQRTLTNGKVIERRGTGEGEPTILPNNIDIVNTNVEGEYTVEYEYKTEKKTRKVVVYQNISPSISYQKEQTRVAKIEGSTTTEKKTETYTSGTWAQNVIVHLSSSAFTESGVTAAKFQWNKDGVWKDFCTSDPCDVKIETEMNQTVQFRMIDSNGKISKTTDQITIKIDNTKPKCTIINDTAIAENNWYNTNVKIKFTEKEDQNTNNVISGIKKYNIYQSGSNIPSDRNIGTINEITHSTDTAGITYYGIIEDEAENYNTCGPVTFKRDATKPVCSVTGHATVGCTDSLSKVNRWYYSKTNTSSGTYDTVTLTNNLSVNATNKVGSSGTYYLYAKDEAGNISEVKSYTYYDVTYNKNNGTTNPTKASDIIRNGNQADLTPTDTRNGYSFVGWNTNASATTKLSSYTVTNHVTLYAIYAECGKGYYSNNKTTCTICPEGYRDGTAVGNKTSESACLRTVAAGYYIASAKATSNTACGNGTYKAQHGVTYGQTSSCTTCPAGYRDGTAVGNKTSESACLMIVPNGKYIKNAKDNSATNCPAGTYQTTHNRTYGQTSGCESCSKLGYSYSSGGGTASSCYNTASRYKIKTVYTCKQTSSYTKNEWTCLYKGSQDYNYCSGGYDECDCWNNPCGGGTPCCCGYTHHPCDQHTGTDYYYEWSEKRTSTVSSCTPVTFECKTQESRNYTIENKVYVSCSGTATYSMSSSTDNWATSCSASSSFNCDSSRVNQSYTTCSDGSYYCTKGVLRNTNECHYS